VIGAAVRQAPVHQLAKCLRSLDPGDTLVVTRLDRLARSTRDLLNFLDQVAKVGAGFKSLAEAWCDTGSPYGELMITILAGLATFERHLILARTTEGLQILSDQFQLLRRVAPPTHDRRRL
jgi:DNA invertase Pin-like site-specific DNA recombinase